MIALIDFFLGLSFFGQSILTSKEIIEEFSIFDKSLGLNRVNNNILGIITAFQIEAIGRRKKIRNKNQKKILLYLKKFLEKTKFLNKKREKDIIYKIFLLKYSEIRNLKKLANKKDINAFCRKMSFIKIKILIKIIQKEPFYFFLKLFRRFFNLIGNYTFNSPGIIITLEKIYKIYYLRDILFQR